MEVVRVDLATEQIRLVWRWLAGEIVFGDRLEIRNRDAKLAALLERADPIFQDSLDLAARKVLKDVAGRYFVNRLVCIGKREDFRAMVAAHRDKAGTRDRAGAEVEFDHVGI